MRHFIGILIFCLIQHAAASQPDTTYIRIEIKETTALYIDPENRSKMIFPIGKTSVPAMNAKSDKSKVLIFAEVFYDGRYYFVLTNSLNLRQPLLDSLQSVNRNTYKDYFKAVHEQVYMTAQAERLAKILKEQKKSDSIRAIEIERQFKKDSLNYNQALRKAIAVGIAVVALDMIENSNSVGVSFTILNTSKKRIKYLWATFDGYNDVGDIEATKTIKCVGPIDPGSPGSYSEEFLMFTKVVSDLRFKSLRIQYFDLSEKTITKQQLQQVVIPDFPNR